MKIPKQEYTDEFKEMAVKRVNEGQTVGAAARELGLIEQTLRNWVKASAAGKFHKTGGKPVTAEQMELSRLRAENARLKQECEILKKATYFAKQPSLSTPGLKGSANATRWTNCGGCWMSPKAATGHGRAAASRTGNT